MICPYNGFKEMNCALCVAHVWAPDGDKGGERIWCMLAIHGCTIPDRPIVALPEVKLDSEWR